MIRSFPDSLSASDEPESPRVRVVRFAPICTCGCTWVRVRVHDLHHLLREGAADARSCPASPPQVPGGIGRLMEGRGGREIQACTRKCVATCVRGGEGAPGLGPLSARWDPVVFKEGFRSRSYCVSECAQVCAIEAGEGGPLRQAGP